MDEKDILEQEEFNLDDIMKEFGGQAEPVEEKPEEPEQPETPAADYKADLVFTSGTTAYCPVCEKDVE